MCLEKGSLDDDDEPIKDIITVGLQNLVEGNKNPLSDYNEVFETPSSPTTKETSHSRDPGSVGSDNNLNNKEAEDTVDNEELEIEPEMRSNFYQPRAGEAEQTFATMCPEKKKKNCAVSQHIESVKKLKIRFEAQK